MKTKKKEKVKHNPHFVHVSLFIGGILLLLCTLFVALCNFVVKRTAEGYIYDDVQAIPARKTGLLLGTMQYTKTGAANRYFINRIEATAQLFLGNKISYILISGDNHRHGYNEPEDMRQSLIAKGVPDSVIYLDYAGFSTFESIVRAQKIFGQDSITIISQKWHNERAVYIAQLHNIDAIAFNANDVRYRKSYLRNHAREVLAKAKAVLDVIFHKQPRYWGEMMQIPGSQDTTFKDSIRSFSYPQTIESKQ